MKYLPYFLKRLLGSAPWKKEWQQELSSSLKEAQQGIPLNLVVIIARESDLYSEVLFILSFLGLTLGSFAAFFLKSYSFATDELISFPVIGFALGATLYSFRRLFISRIAPRAVREKVTEKAKGQFFDHLQSMKQRLVLIYVSEIEREAFMFSSPDISSLIPSKEIQRSLSKLVINYSLAKPLLTLRPALLEIGQVLRSSFGTVVSEADLTKKNSPEPIFMGASDKKPIKLEHVHMLKGNKDIN